MICGERMRFLLKMFFFLAFAVVGWGIYLLIEMWLSIACLCSGCMMVFLEWEVRIGSDFL